MEVWQIGLALAVVIVGLFGLTLYLHQDTIRAAWGAEMQSVQEHKANKRRKK